MLNGADRIFEFRADSHEEAVDWVGHLQVQIGASQGRKHSLSLGKGNKFWKNDRISEEQFRGIADTGDIVLFSGLNAGSKLTRSVTMSDYGKKPIQNDAIETWYVRPHRSGTSLRERGCGRKAER